MRIQKTITRHHVLLVLSASCSAFSLACSTSYSAFSFLRKVATKTHAGTVTL
ncbi:hypothetical protein KVE07_07755 [Helicobacter pylori]|nr:hypothetical protein KVE07_07755 [Helicobacter pylori]